MKSAYLLLIFSIITLVSCRKEEHIVLSEPVTTGTALDVHGLFFTDALHGYACGGSLYDAGVWWKTEDGGKSWCCIDSVYIKCAYSVTYLNASQGVISGFDGFIARTSNGGEDWDIINIPGWEPVLDLYVQGLNGWVIAGGTSFDKGFLGRSADGGQNWQMQEVPHRMESLHSRDGQHLVAGGFGGLYYSCDSGKSWLTDAQRGDFYTDVYMPDGQHAVAVGQQGSILFSDTRGQQWRVVKSVNHPFEAAESFEAVHFYDAQNGMAVGMGGLIYGTEDGGQSWYKIKSFTGMRLRDVIMTSPTAAVVAGERGTIFRVQRE